MTRRRKRRRARIRGLTALTLVVALLGGAAYMMSDSDGDRDVQAQPEPSLPQRTANRPAPSDTPEAETTKAPPPPSSDPADREIPVPDSGPGTFTTAQSAGKVQGSGTLYQYSVQVEDGIELSAEDAAAEIAVILDHPRGWTSDGKNSFQLVSSGADLVVKIATPDTADQLCGALGMDTGGEYNCETGNGVVVNLKRWATGSPTFKGVPKEYRHLIINHEFGHALGYKRHVGCPGPGKLAPVMMQQIKGLDGCVSNAWPFDEDGEYATGPFV